VTTAKQEILDRIRTALGGERTAPPVERGYHTTSDDRPGSAPVLDLLEDRLVDYKATVHRCRAAQVGDTVRAVLAPLLPEGGKVVVPPGLPDDWVPGATVDQDFDPLALDEFAAVVTCSAATAARTGTIVLDGSPDQGRRAITLVPDVHVCVVRADQVVDTVPELLARLDPTRPLTFISGPSATSDIELQRVEGVHGPRTLAVVLVEE
jgi:L-lactate dehydrogenase complex protein LldG